MIKKTTIIFGIILTLFGLMGFLPNPIVGRHAFFITDTFHNIIHLIIGFCLLAIALRGEGASLKALKIFGGFFVLLAILGFFAEEQKFLGVMAINNADTWLHFILGGILLFYSEKFSKNEAEK